MWSQRMPRRNDEMTERRTATTAWRRFTSTLRRIVGMPDYSAYVDHMRRRHPGCAVPTEREFFEQYVTARYSGGPTRCC